MTATTTDLGTRRGQAALGHTRRLAQIAGTLLGAIGARWSDFVDASQLGPRADAVTSRHTGARI
ncbi:MAG: hypothetical protein KY392_04020 [Chloroflexi bacterium]|nr:hypothetical protein [Chloroflexota bacterium]